MGNTTAKRFMIVFIFLIVIIGLFTGLYIFTEVKKNTRNDEYSGSNPYANKNLHQETIKQLNDPLYQNIILPEELDKRLQNNDSLYVYFYSPTCVHCRNATPKLMQAADQLNKEVLMFNLLEFENGWDDYQIEGTPTLLKYEKGLESLRLEGDQADESYVKFFSSN
ncbi:thioredoxin family protein [Brevibacillus fortis]|uniref:thioredoxin family protein n=1 Tax=Brevibacillus fortis TaxID=2126352 RepID=UPI0038FC2D72